jgi:hypothetical protein
MSIFTKVWAWLKKEFVSIETHAAHVAVAIGEMAKEALQNGSLDVIAKVVDLITKSSIGDEAEAALKSALPKIIAVSAAIETHPDATWTTDEVQAWEKKILDAFNIHGNKSVIYTLIAAQAYGVLNSLKANPGKPTFGAWVGAVEEIYTLWEKDNETNP